MTVELPILVLGSLLLWFPRSWMRRGWAFLRRRRRSPGSARITDPWQNGEPGDPRVSFRVEFTKLRNYLDLLRGGVGSLVFMGGIGLAPAIAAPPGATGAAAMRVMLVIALVFLVGLLIQTTRYENKRMSFYPPIFYLAGLSVGLCDARAAAFAFIGIWAINPALPNAQAFLTVYAAVMVIFAHFFAWTTDLSALLAGTLCFLPVLLSLLTRRPLQVFSRRSSRVSGQM